MSEPMDDNGYSIWRVDPVTRKRFIRVAQDLSATEVMAFLNPPAGATVAFQSQYEVIQQFDGASFSAERFLIRPEPGPVTVVAGEVVHEWLRGATNGADPQRLVRRQWPELAELLDKLMVEVHGAGS